MVGEHACALEEAVIYGNAYATSIKEAIRLSWDKLAIRPTWIYAGADQLDVLKRATAGW